MARKRRKDQATKSATTRAYRRVIWFGTGALLLGATLVSASMGLTALDRHVDAMVTPRFAPQIILDDFPPALESLARAEIERSLSACLVSPWTAADLPRRMHDAVSSTGWVSRVISVRRAGDARFQVRCDYRMPAARIKSGSSFVMVDASAVRLPGTYWEGQGLMEIRGVRVAPPPPGHKWDGADLRCGLDLVRILQAEPFANQIVAVDVDNAAGRKDRWSSHVDLITDLDEARVRWGSGPGEEIEENTVAQKLGLLREIYRQTGRMDAYEVAIDISTRPDQFLLLGRTGKR